MPDRITERIYTPWVRRYASVILFTLIIGSMFLAFRRFENLVAQVQEQDRQLQESCDQRALARAAVRAIVLDVYMQLAEVQVAVGIVPADPQTVEAAVNTALPPLSCD